jgi:RHS repeat-associated protein
VTFAYDGDQQRARKTALLEETTYFAGLYERVREPVSGGELHRYYVPAGSATVVVIRTPGEVAPCLGRNCPPLGGAGVSETLYLHGDALGSVDVVTDRSGAVVERRSYDAFGVRRSPQWGRPAPGPFPEKVPVGFTGHAGDEELGLVNMQGRIYDPRLGRFLMTDPLVSDPLNGQRWNAYSYVLNNPLKYIDPSGFDEVIVNGKPAGPELVVTPGDDYQLARNLMSAPSPGRPRGDPGAGRDDAVTPDPSRGEPCYVTATPDGPPVLIGYRTPPMWQPDPLTARVHRFLKEDCPTCGAVVEAVQFVGAALPAVMGGRDALRSIRPPGRTASSIPNSVDAPASVATGEGPLLFGQKRIAPNFRMYSEASDAIRGRSLVEVAEGLKSGAIHPDALPVDYFVARGQRIAVNNRGLAALRMAGMESTVVRQVPADRNLLGRLGEQPIDAAHSFPGSRIAVTTNKDGTGHLYTVVGF